VRGQGARHDERAGIVFGAPLAARASGGVVGLLRIEPVAALLDARHDGIARAAHAVVNMRETGPGQEISRAHVARDRIALGIYRADDARATIRRIDTS